MKLLMGGCSMPAWHKAAALFEGGRKLPGQRREDRVSVLMG